MFVLFRAITYSALFIGFVLVYLPARVLAGSGIVRPELLEPQQIAGLAMGALGATVALSCIATFAIKGEGTPAPFDPPRKLVVRGPYRLQRRASMVAERPRPMIQHPPRLNREASTRFPAA